MALKQDRKRIFVRAPGNCEIREVDPTPGENFEEVGYLDGTTLNDLYETEIVQDENGNTVAENETSRLVAFDTGLLQTSKEEIDLLRNAKGKIHSVRYGGMTQHDVFQYYCIEQARLNPSVQLPFKRGKRALPLRAVALDLTDEKGYEIPLYYLYEGARKIRTKHLHLWNDPRLGHNVLTARDLDISGFGRHGLLNSDYATIWQTGTPERFLRFDGVNDQLDLGNILNDDASGDFLMELWVRVQAANGTKEEILSKKALIDDNSAGFSIYRTTGNLLTFRLSSGSASGTVSNSTTTLQNVWRHFAVAVDRNGNATPYLNGAVDGSPASVAAIGTGTNALSLYLGRDGTNFGQVDIGGRRIYRFGAGGLPSDIATIISNHYNAEKAFYGL